MVVIVFRNNKGFEINSLFKQRLSDNFVQELYATIRDKDRYLPYRSVKARHGSAKNILMFHFCMILFWLISKLTA